MLLIPLDVIVCRIRTFSFPFTIAIFIHSSGGFVGTWDDILSIARQRHFNRQNWAAVNDFYRWRIDDLRDDIVIDVFL